MLSSVLAPQTVPFDDASFEVSLFCQAALGATSILLPVITKK